MKFVVFEEMFDLYGKSSRKPRNLAKILSDLMVCRKYFFVDSSTFPSSENKNNYVLIRVCLPTIFFEFEEFPFVQFDYFRHEAVVEMPQENVRRTDNKILVKFLLFGKNRFSVDTTFVTFRNQPVLQPAYFIQVYVRNRGEKRKLPFANTVLLKTKANYQKETHKPKPHLHSSDLRSNYSTTAL